MHRPCKVKALTMFVYLHASSAFANEFADYRGMICSVWMAQECLIRANPDPFDLPPTRVAPRSARRTDVHKLKIRTNSRAMLAASLCLAAFVLTSCASPTVVMSVPERRAPNAALVLCASEGDYDDMMRNDSTLGAHRDALIRVSDDVEIAVTDRQWEYNGRPYTFYRASTVTRERLVR